MVVLLVSVRPLWPRSPPGTEPARVLDISRTTPFRIRRAIRTVCLTSCPSTGSRGAWARDHDPRHRPLAVAQPASGWSRTSGRLPTSSRHCWPCRPRTRDSSVRAVASRTRGPPRGRPRIAAQQGLVVRTHAVVGVDLARRRCRRHRVAAGARRRRGCSRLSTSSCGARTVRRQHPRPPQHRCARRPRRCSPHPGRVERRAGEARPPGQRLPADAAGRAP